MVAFTSAAAEKAELLKRPIATSTTGGSWRCVKLTYRSWVFGLIWRASNLALALSQGKPIAAATGFAVACIVVVLALDRVFECELPVCGEEGEGSRNGKRRG
jgi:hypothetical protein